MKKFIKVCAITGGILVLVGGITSTLAASMGANLNNAVIYSNNTWGGSWMDRMAEDISDDVRNSVKKGINPFRNDWDDDYDYDYDYDYFDFDDTFGMSMEELYDNAPKSLTGRLQFSTPGITKLDVEVQEGVVVFVEQEDSDFIGVFSEEDNRYWSAKRDEEELKIKAVPSSRDTKNYSESTVYLYVPKGMVFDSVDLEIKSRQRKNKVKNENHYKGIYAKELAARELDIECDAGVVQIADGNVGKMSINGNVCGLEYVGTINGNLEAECNVGAINLDIAGQKTDFNYEIKAKVGSVTVGDQIYAGLASTTRESHDGASKRMELDCKVGVIDVQFY